MRSRFSSAITRMVFLGVVLVVMSLFSPSEPRGSCSWDMVFLSGAVAVGDGVGLAFRFFRGLRITVVQAESVSVGLPVVSSSSGVSGVVALALRGVL